MLTLGEHSYTKYESGQFVCSSCGAASITLNQSMEGNGRATRIWLDCMLKKEIGMVVDWSKVDKEDYLLAMERSPVRDIEIKHVLRAALTDQVNSREMFMKGIDHSYYYEGYTAFQTEKL